MTRFAFMWIILFVPIALSAQTDQKAFDETLLRSLTQQAPIIVIAKVMEVGDSPGYSSGYVLSTQRVMYEVQEVLRGNIRGRTFMVSHLVVLGSQTSDKDGGHLSPSIFQKGNSLVLFLRRGNARTRFNLKSRRRFVSYHAMNENCVPVATDENIRYVRRYLSSHENKNQKAQAFPFDLSL